MRKAVNTELAPRSGADAVINPIKWSIGLWSCSVGGMFKSLESWMRTAPFRWVGSFVTWTFVTDLFPWANSYTTLYCWYFCKHSLADHSSRSLRWGCRENCGRWKLGSCGSGGEQDPTGNWARGHSCYILATFWVWSWESYIKNISKNSCIFPHYRLLSNDTFTRHSGFIC